MIKEIRDDLELILLTPTISFEALRKVYAQLEDRRMFSLILN